MSIPIDRKVTFGRRTKNGRSNYDLVRFAIEPPIVVHDPNFFQETVYATSGNENAIGYYDVVHGVKVSFSDDTGTYGSLKVHSDATPEMFKDVVTAAFRSELELGNAALSFIFR